MKYEVTGMSCAACSARVQKAVSAVDGVTSCDVNLLTNSMLVEGDAAARDVISAVKAAGYGARLMKDTAQDELEALTDGEPKKISRRLLISVILLVPEMYLSMGVAMFSWPDLVIFGNHKVLWVTVAVLTLAIMIVNRKFFIGGVKGLVHRAPNMDTLVAMGSFASFAYSMYYLILLLLQSGDTSAMAHDHMDNMFFDSAAMILVLITVGKLLEAKSKGKTTTALKSLIQLAPQTAVLIRNGKEITVPAGEIKQGDIFVVRPGDSIPADGEIIEGESALNEAMLTGESLPVDKTAGDEVSAGTINVSGFLKCRALKVGSDTALSQIIKLVSDSAASKAPIAKIADKVSGVFVPVVIVIAIITFAVWMIAGKDTGLGFALSRAISVLVVSCPCALGLATPVAIMVGNGVAAKNGILFKTSAAMEECGRLEIIALDKTGTVTEGQPSVTDVFPTEGTSREELLHMAASLEALSEHPLAKAIVKAAESEGIEIGKVSGFKALSGSGIKGEINGIKACAGNAELAGENTDDKDAITRALSLGEKLASEGKTPLYFVLGGKYLGLIAVADVIKSDAAEAVKHFESMGLEVFMLTGDNQRTANAVAKSAGIKNVIAGVKPDEKAQVISRLLQRGKTAMVGDGINDAPALTGADIGIAIGAGTDVAIDAADVVLMKGSLLDAAGAVRLSRTTLRNIYENLFWAFFYNIIGIPLAAGVFIPINGWMLTPMFGAAAMSISSFLVVSNALRIGARSIYDPRRDRKKKAFAKKTKQFLGLMLIGLFLSSCSLTEDEAAVNPAPVDTQAVSEDGEETASESPVTGAGINIGARAIDNPLVYYTNARNKTQALESREFRSIIYTKAGTGNGAVTESVNMHVIVTGENGDMPVIHAKGNVKSGEEVVPIEIYYTDKVMYSSGRAGSEKTQCTFEEAISQVDVLYELRKAMTADTVSSIECRENADGTVIVSLGFTLTLGDFEVSGTDELLVNSLGVITSEGISISSEGGSGLPVGQSIEYTLIVYGQDVAPITLPDLSKY